MTNLCVQHGGTKLAGSQQSGQVFSAALLQMVDQEGLDTEDIRLKPLLLDSHDQIMQTDFLQ